MELEWTDVMHYQQQMQRLIRLLLPQKPGRLTASEWELLSWLYLKPGQNRPMQLSQCSGMKKEAVSRLDNRPGHSASCGSPPCGSWPTRSVWPPWSHSRAGWYSRCK